MHTVRCAIALTVATIVVGCGDSCREYSDFSCSYLEKAEYTAFFYFPRGSRFESSEVNLGTLTGLHACGAAAYSFAASKGLSSSSEWSYVCCLHAKGSSCYEKHR